MSEKTSSAAAAGSSIAEQKKQHGVSSDALLSARSAYMAAGCLEKVGGNIKVKQTAGKYAPVGSKQSTKKGGTATRTSKASSSRIQRGAHHKDLSNSMEKTPNELVAGSSSMTQQQQKSMSTTNLFDVNLKITAHESN
jgi:hypothetical protein